MTTRCGCVGSVTWRPVLSVTVSSCGSGGCCARGQRRKSAAAARHSSAVMMPAFRINTSDWMLSMMI